MLSLLFSRTLPSFLGRGALLLVLAFFLTGCASKPGQGSKRFPERITDWSVVSEEQVFFAEARQWPGVLFPLFEGENPQLLNIRTSPTRDSVFMLFYTAVPRAEAAEIRVMVINFNSRELIYDDTYQYINQARNLPQPKWTFGGRTLVVEHPGLGTAQVVPF